MRIRVLGWVLLVTFAAIIVITVLTGDEKDVQPPTAYLTPEKIVFDPRLQAEVVGDRVLLTLHDGVSDGQLRRVLEGLGFPARVVSRVPALKLVAVEVPKEQLHAARFRLGNHPYVAAAGYSFLYEPTRTFDDPALGGAPRDDWGLQRIDIERAWDVTTGGAVVAILDSGTQLTHQETDGRTRNAWSYFTRSAAMQSGRVIIDTSNGERATWITGHGTHVAVTAAGRAGNGAGTAGVAPDSPIMPIQVLGYLQNPRRISGSTDQIAQGIRRATDDGAAVINLSLGRKIPPAVRDAYNRGDPEVRRQLEAAAEAELDGYRAAIDYAVSRGVIIVKSAGNSRLPAALDGMSLSRRVISVAATAQGDTRASFSNHGDFTTVSAPGADIWSAWPDPGEPYLYLDGTSMAAPHVTGIVALMKTVKPDLRFEEARDILVATATRLRTDLPIGPLVSAAAAVQEANRRAGGGEPTPEPEPPLLPEPPGPPTRPELPPEDEVLARPDPWNHPDVQRLIDLWLSISTPPGPPEGAPWFWDKYGRMLNGRNVYATQPPDWASYRYRFLWEQAKKLRSVAHGTLYEFIMGMLRDGRFDPAPGTPPDAPPDTTPPTPTPDGPKPVVRAQTPKQLFQLLIQAVKERRLEMVYDLVTISARNEMEKMVAEVKREIRSAPADASMTRAARKIGFPSVDAYLKADVRTILHRMGVAHEEALMDMPNWLRLVRVELDAGGRSGVMVMTEEDGDEDPVRIRIENGSWRFDPDDLR